MKINIAGIIKEPGNITRNKTGSWRNERPVRDKSKCTKCMSCYRFCPENAIDKNIRINYDYCKGCGICAEVCPAKAIRMIKEEK